MLSRRPRRASDDGRGHPAHRRDPGHHLLEPPGARPGRVNEELQQVNQLNADVLGVVGHDVRRPLALVLGQLEVLDRDLAGVLAGGEHRPGREDPGSRPPARRTARRHPRDGQLRLGRDRHPTHAGLRSATSSPRHWPTCRAAPRWTYDATVTRSVSSTRSTCARWSPTWSRNAVRYGAPPVVVTVRAAGRLGLDRGHRPRRRRTRGVRAAPVRAVHPGDRSRDGRRAGPAAASGCTSCAGSPRPTAAGSATSASDARGLVLPPRGADGSPTVD